MKKTTSQIVTSLLLTIHFSFLTFGFQLLTFDSKAQTPNWHWAKSGASFSVLLPNSISSDANGNSYVTVWTPDSAIVFGGDTLTSTTHYFVMKFDGSGNELWAKTAGMSNTAISTGIITDVNSNCYVTGYFIDTITFGSDTLIGNGNNTSLFVVKYDSLGNVIWAKSAIGDFNANNKIKYSISTDAKNNIYVTGTFGKSSPQIGDSSIISFGNITLSSNGGIMGNVFIVKFDSSGNALWAKKAEGDFGDYCNSISTDANGNSYITGYFKSPTIIFDSITLTNSGNPNTFVAKYNVNGNLLWAKCNSVGTAYGKSISHDSNGNCYVTGFFNSNYVIFGGITLAGAGLEDFFILKYDSLGNVVWAKSAGGPGAEEANSIKTDFNGNSFLTGFFGSSMMIFGNSILINTGGVDVFVAKYDSLGNAIWGQKAGGDKNECGNSISIDENENSYITGYFNSNYPTFSNITLFNEDTINNSAENFVAKLKNVTIGIEEINNLINAINIYPNPANNYFTLSMTPDIKQVQILNSLGQILHSVITKNQINLSFTIETAGIYFIMVKTDRETVIKKLMIVK